MEEIQLRTPKNKFGPAKADITRTASSKRLAKALGIGIGGTVLGLATLPIPIVHLIAPWAVPLFSIFLAVNVYRTGPKILRIEGTCPTCGGPIVETNVGNVANDLWIRCPSCNEALRPEVETAE